MISESPFEGKKRDIWISKFSSVVDCIVARMKLEKIIECSYEAPL